MCIRELNCAHDFTFKILLFNLGNTKKTYARTGEYLYQKMRIGGYRRERFDGYMCTYKLYLISGYHMASAIACRGLRIDIVTERQGVQHITSVSATMRFKLCGH